MKASHRIIIIGGSAGSLDMVMKILHVLNKDIGFSVVLVLHRKTTNDTILVDLLSLKTKFGVKEAEEKEIIQPDMVYIAPADYHLLIEQDGSFSLDASEKINYSRPSIDVSFESAALVFKKNLMGILLSGANSDGVDGLKVIKKNGGLIVVQDPLSAVVSYMPQQAINNVAVDIILFNEGVDTLIDRLNGLRDNS
jgi:two-component system, chemotaxis family, protein-glutamate methylesterase/glutaminase